jgi:hypothetical protein
MRMKFIITIISIGMIESQAEERRLLIYYKWATFGLRILGITCVYNFFAEAVSAVNILAGLYYPRNYTSQGMAFLAILNLMTGIYLIFYPKKIMRIILNDKHLEEADEASKNSDFKKLGFVALKLFGVFLFYKFMYYMVTAFNVATGNWMPSYTDATAFVIQAVLHLGVGLFLMFQTRIVAEVIFRDIA